MFDQVHPPCDELGRRPRRISFLGELHLTEGDKRDWPYFARWHYRSHTLGPVKRITLLWHGERPIGICVFCAPAAQLRLRNEFFGWSLRPGSPRRSPYGNGYGNRLRAFLKMLNRSVWVLSRVVLHPTYRGAGIASAFVRQSCAGCRVPWIEALSVMGHANPLFERAGFARVGVVKKRGRRDPRTHARIYGGRHELSAETVRKSLHAEPVYYLLDNRRRQCAAEDLGPLAGPAQTALPAKLDPSDAGNRRSARETIEAAVALP